MIIKTLRVVNFKSLQDETIDFKNGVTLIRGLNESGKSTIMEAILYALFGYVLKPKMNPAKTKIIEYNSPRALVQLTFEIAGKTYQVTREIFRSEKRSSEANIVELLPNGKSIPQGTQSFNEVSNTIKKLLGDISYNELVSSCIVAQKELAKLVELSSGERKDIINIFLNLHHFNKIKDRLKDMRRDLLGKRELGGGRIHIEKEKLERLNSERELYDNYSSEKDKKSGILNELKSNLDDYSPQLENKNTLLEKLEEYYKKQIEKRELDQVISGLNYRLEIQKKRQEKLNGLENTQVEMQLKLEELNYVNTASTIMPNIEDYVQEHQKLNQRVYALEKNEGEQREKHKEQSIKTERLRPTPKEQEILSSVVNLRIVGTMTVIIALLCILGILVNTLFLLGAFPFSVFMIYVIYQYLRRVSLSEKNSTFLGEQKSLQTLVESLKNLEDNIREIKMQMDLHLTEIETLVDTLPPEFGELWIDRDIEHALHIIEEYNQQVRELDEVQTNLENIEKQLEEKPAIEAEVKRLTREIKTESERSNKITFPELPVGVEFSEKLKKQTRDDVVNLEKTIAGTKKEVEGLETRISELQQYLIDHDGIHQKCEDQKEKVDGLIEEEKITSVIMDALETTSENLRKRVRPNVQQYMGQILPVITANRYKAARLSDDYAVEVWSDDAGEYQEKEMFSGGTEDQFLLAMRIAFALALLPIRKHTQPEFLFLDEPLGSSDAVRREGIMNLTQTVLAENFQQIIIISHVEGLEEYIDNTIEVEAGRIIATSSSGL